MSDNTPTESPVLLRSPFNGEAWPVPPDVNPAMFEALLKAGFTRITPEPARKRKDIA